MNATTEQDERERIAENLRRIATAIWREMGYDDCDDVKVQRLNEELAEASEHLRLWLLGLTA